MSYRAVENLEVAYEATKELLLPFELRRWLVVAVVAFFVSGTTGFNVNTNLSALDVPDAVPVPDPGVGLGAGLGLVEVLALAGVVVLVALIAAYTAAVLEFVFVRMVSDRAIRIRGYFGETRSKGTSLFAFRLLLALFTISMVIFVVGAVLVAGVVGAVIAVVLSPVFLLAFLALALVSRLTVDFVVPVMLADDIGIVAGWRRFIPELRTNLTEYAVYILVRVALGVVAGIVVAVGFTAVGIVVSIPFLTLAALVLLVESAAGLGSVIFLLLAGIFTLAVLVVVVVATTLVQVPVQTYLRYYSLFVLGDVSPAYDLVHEKRSSLGDAAEPESSTSRGDEP